MSDGIGQITELMERLASEIAPLDSLGLDGLSVQDAETKLREVGDLRVKLTGKKSELAAAMKKIGAVAPEQRAEFAQAVQAINKGVTAKLDAAEPQGHVGEPCPHQGAGQERIRIEIEVQGRERQRGHRQQQQRTADERPRLAQQPATQTSSRCSSVWGRVQRSGRCSTSLATSSSARSTEPPVAPSRAPFTPRASWRASRS